MQRSAEVDQYISGFPEKTQEFLNLLREIIIHNAAEADEVISYAMPAFKLNGMLVYYAAYPNHIGFYPTPSGIAAFEKELSGYKMAKGSVQFPLDKPLPLDLIAGIVKFRVAENLQKSKPKKK